MTAAAPLSPTDEAHLERARVLARRGWGGAHPNPLVGCVLAREGRVVGEGWHVRYGGPHAEVAALEVAGAEAAGATAYVSLEPCDHHGQTPPCTEALVRAGVRRVIFGARDPGAVSGGGGEALRAAGLEVVGPVWTERRARAENPAFFHLVRHETPFVALKLAMTLDARVASGPGQRTRITGPAAEREVHRLRSGFDAVLVGAGTARADDPRLTVRLTPAGRTPPRRMVLSPRADLPASAAVLRQGEEHGPVDVFVGDDAPRSDVRRLEGAGASVHAVHGTPEGLDLGQVTRVAWELGVRSVFCEGGPRLGASLLAEARVQRLYLFLAPKVLGPDGVTAFPAEAAAAQWAGFEPLDAPAIFGSDVLLVLDRAEHGEDAPQGAVARRGAASHDETGSGADRAD